MRLNPKILLICCLTLAIISCRYREQKDAGTTESSDQEFQMMGDSLARASFDTLRNTLARKIIESGPEGAVRFCNAQALKLTSSYSTENISISRVTDRPRNPANSLSDLDREQFEKYKNLLAGKDSLHSMVISKDNRIHYYKPIIIQTMCLNCHGEPGKDINPALVKLIDSLYPSDKAKGYKAGDLRGMWSIVKSER